MLLPAAARAATWHESGGHAGENIDHNPHPAMTFGLFDAHDAATIQAYYRAMAAAGACPPGLIRTGESCLATGQPRRWVLGKPLPDELPTETLPPDLTARLLQLEGSHYVRVGADVLRVADGTGIVQAGVPDLIR